jgi:hypothetical protein
MARWVEFPLLWPRFLDPARVGNRLPPANQRPPADYHPPANQRPTSAR